jgi:hypothetical protein
MRCESPQRGTWGGPPNGQIDRPLIAANTAFAPRGKLELARVIQRDLWEIGFERAPAKKPAASRPAAPKSMWFAVGVLVALLVLIRALRNDRGQCLHGVGCTHPCKSASLLVK